MARSTDLQNSFAAGELSPRLEGRTDISAYKNGCKTLQNYGVWSHGGAFKRPGTKFISTAGDFKQTINMIPFIYSVEQTYVLELGNEYMRFFTDGGIILASGSSSPYEVTTLYSSDEVDDVKYVQNADVMYIAHSDVHPQKLTRYGHDNWTIEDMPVINGPWREENLTTTTITPSATTGGVTLSGSDNIWNAEHVGAYYKFRGTQSEYKEITAQNTWTDTILSVDRNDQLLIEMKGTWVATVTLQRSSDEGDNWIDVYQHTANAAVSLTEEVSDDVWYRLGVKTGDYTSGTVKATLGKLDQYGYVLIQEYTSPTLVSGTVIAELPSADATARWSESAWSDYRGYPSAVAFYEERLIFAGTKDAPQTIWGSQVDDYENFEPGVNDDDAYTFTLASNNVNKIQSMVDSSVLHIFTTGGEWRMGEVDVATTPTNITVRRETTYGSNSVQPIPISNVVLFMQSGGKKLRQRYYNYEPEQWISPDISVLSEHLLYGGIEEMCYCDQPDPTIWMLRTDGVLAGCTFDLSQKVIAFHELITDGEFESITSIPHSGRDELWACVKRETSSGTTTRFIEQFQTTKWDTLVESCFLDSAISYSGVPATTVSGMDHLEGLEVGVTTSGAVHPNVTVTDGIITLEYEAGQITAGLEYTAVLETMDVEVINQYGTSQAKTKAIPVVDIRFYNTINAKVGPTTDNIDIIPFRSAGDPMGVAPPLFTGIKQLRFPKGWDKEVSVCIISDSPTPIHILSIIPTISASSH